MATLKAVKNALARKLDADETKTKKQIIDELAKKLEISAEQIKSILSEGRDHSDTLNKMAEVLEVTEDDEPKEQPTGGKEESAKESEDPLKKTLDSAFGSQDSVETHLQKMVKELDSFDDKTKEALKTIIRKTLEAAPLVVMQSSEMQHLKKMSEELANKTKTIEQLQAKVKTLESKTNAIQSTTSEMQKGKGIYSTTNDSETYSTTETEKEGDSKEEQAIFEQSPFDRPLGDMLKEKYAG